MPFCFRTTITDHEMKVEWLKWRLKNESFDNVVNGIKEAITTNDISTLNAVFDDQELTTSFGQQVFLFF